MRIALLNAIYEKSLKLSRAAKQTQTTGETVNVMSTDTQRLFQMLLFAHVVTNE
jgi:hypothetical protein